MFRNLFVSELGCTVTVERAVRIPDAERPGAFLMLKEGERRSEVYLSPKNIKQLKELLDQVQDEISTNK